jgi:hypothetical protein
LAGCSAHADEGVDVADMIEAGAIDLLAARLRTPLQIELHLTLAFEAAYRIGAKPVPVEVVEGVLSRAIDDLERTLTRNCYDASTLTREFGAKPVEIRSFLAGTLGAERTRELTDQMRAAGVPV